jgi:uncharacterized phage protein (TIGR01671 family)
MRQIIFRGKRKDNGKWVYGWYAPLVCNDKTVIPNIKDYNGSDWKVIPETVGQFTGRYDKSNNKIFGGDIVKCLSLEYGYVNKEVYYSEVKGKFVLHSCGTDYEFDEYINVEVVGDIHDDAELLEVVK